MTAIIILIILIFGILCGISYSMFMTEITVDRIKDILIEILESEDKV